MKIKDKGLFIASLCLILAAVVCLGVINHGQDVKIKQMQKQINVADMKLGAIVSSKPDFEIGDTVWAMVQKNKEVEGTIVDIQCVFRTKSIYHSNFSTKDIMSVQYKYTIECYWKYSLDSEIYEVDEQDISKTRRLCE